MKKAISVLLAIILCLTVPAAAYAAAPAADGQSAGGLQAVCENLANNVADLAGDVTISGADAGDAVTGVILDAFNEAGATASVPGTATAAAQPAGDAAPLVAEKTYTAKELAREIRRYMFIKVDDPDAVAAALAESCVYNYAVVNGEDGTLYIRVDVEHNPQIFNYDVFRSFVEKLYLRQGEEMKKYPDGQIDYVMSYEHIAGELALHAIVLAASNGIIAVTNTTSERILSLYRASAVADLNADENRAPAQLIAFLGKLIIYVFRYNVLKLFSFLA